MEMNDSDARRLSRSALFGLFFWLLIFFLFALIPQRIQEKPVKEFTSVRLILNQKETPSPSGSAPQSSSVTTMKTTSPTSKPTSRDNTVTGKAKTTGLGIANFSKPITPSNDTRAEYLDFTSSEQSTQTQSESARSTGKSLSEFEGSAGSVQKNIEGAVRSSQNVKTTDGKDSSSASSDTLNSLSQINDGIRTGSGAVANTVNSASSSDSSLSSSTDDRSSRLSGLAFDGLNRKLISPTDPSIVLPANLARLVDSDRTVTVQFTVRPDGSVPLGLISFTPASVLPAEIRDYLKKEFSRWRFEQSAQDGQAHFVYSIRVR